MNNENKILSDDQLELSKPEGNEMEVSGESNNDAPVQKNFSKPTFYRILCLALIIFAGSFLLYTLSFEVILRPISVLGYSMQPNINASAKGENGDQYNDAVYYTLNTSNLNYGDVVIIGGNYTGKAHSIIKRIIACPGQTITFKLAHAYHTRSGDIYDYVDVYVDGVLLDELSEDAPYKIKSRMEVLIDSFVVGYTTFSYNLTNYGEVTYNLTDGQYFVMGDNRNNSTDSRYFGPVNASDIEGKVVLFVPYGENALFALFKKLFG